MGNVSVPLRGNGSERKLIVSVGLYDGPSFRPLAG